MSRNICEAAADFEEWLGQQVLLDETDLDLKHEKMAEDPFQFLRATYYRWPEWNSDAVEGDSVEVNSVGDLHVQNYGTWRDAEGRLVWGVNDFDEADVLPFTSDLVRLAVSAHLAHKYAKGVEFEPGNIEGEILGGYREALELGGSPHVLDRDHEWLLELAQSALKKPKKFWEKWLEKKTQPAEAHEIPDSAREALKKAFHQVPGVDVKAIEWRKRGDEPKGLGSLGRPRVFGFIADWKGGPLAREAKAAALPYTARFAEAEKMGIHFPEIIKAAVRSPDPFYQLQGDWIVRPVAADVGRIDFEDVDGGVDDARLLRAMGFETANTHLGSHSGVRSELMKALKDLTEESLRDATKAVLKRVLADFEAWRSAPISK